MTSTDDQLDAAIDAVAREMTADGPADPSAFRRRVLDGIDGNAARRRTWRWAPVWVSLAAAAAMVIALVLEPTTVRLPARRSAVETERSAGAKAPFGVAQGGPGPAEGPDTTSEATVRLPARRRSPQNDRSGGEKPPFDVARGSPEPVEGPDTAYAATVRPPAPLVDVAQGGRPPLLTIAPIDVTPLGAARLAAADSIELERLDAIAPIDVTPLGLDDSQRRDK